VSQPAELPPEWRRTSPKSFLVGGIVGLRNSVLPVAAALIGSQGARGAGLYLLPAVAVWLGLTFVFSYLAWRHFRYCVGGEDIRVERGLVRRTARTVPYERIQDVSLEQTLVPRLFGMVEARFETGAGGKDEIKIRFIGRAEGEVLRETVRARKSGEAIAGSAADAPPAEARTLFAMDTGRLAVFGLFEFSLVAFAVLGGSAQQLDFLLPFDFWDYRGWIGLFAGPGHWLQQLGFAAQAFGVAIALFVLALLGLITGLGRTVLRDYGFLLEETPKGLRRRRGLLTRSDTVMPIHRVQALKVTTGIVRRRFGWHGLSVVSLAQDTKAGNQVAVPFAKMAEISPVVEVAEFALPPADAKWHRASARAAVDRAILRGAMPMSAGIALLLGARLVPAEAEIALALPITGLLLLGGFFALRERFLWHYHRHAIDDRFLYQRHGWLVPSLDIAMPVKLQSVEIAQGPLARWRGYADLKLGVAGGRFTLHGIPLESARAVRRTVLDSIARVDFSRLAG
jgi:putative membrane protein